MAPTATRPASPKRGIPGRGQNQCSRFTQITDARSSLIRAAADNAMPDDDAATVRPLRADQLEPALRVIEAAQHLAATGGDLNDTLAGLARQLT